MLAHIRRPTPDQLKSWSRSKKAHRGNIFKDLFDDLASILVTNYEPDLGFGRAYEGEDSDLSTSSNEAPQQDSSQRVLVALVKATLENGDFDTVVGDWALAP